jgi:gas vesicle protein
MADDDNRLEKAMLDTVRELAEKLGTIRTEVRNDVTQEIARFREDVHRAIMAIQSRLVQMEDAQQRDVKERVTRQQQMDRRHYWRLALELITLLALIVLIVVVAIAYFGRR